MQWNEIQSYYPHQWVLIEAVEAHSEFGKRILDRIAVLEAFPASENSSDAMESYKDIHIKFPERELYVVHTDREQLDIRERVWLGIRPAARST